MNVLTLDVGGTKARGRLYRDGEERQFELARGFGLAEDREELDEELYTLLLSQGFDAGEIDVAVVNLGGKNKEQIRCTLQKAFPKARVQVYRESEGTIARTILSLYGANVLMMAGTGCIAFSCFGDRERVLGGWGAAFNDEGSGYYVGRTAIEYALREADGERDELSPFTQALTGLSRGLSLSCFEKYASARDLVRSKIPTGRREVAALAKTVADCARQGCPLSLKVLKEHAEQAAGLIIRAIGGETQTPVVVVNGGVASFAELWKEDLFAALEGKVKRENIYFTNRAIDEALKKLAEAEI